MKASFILDDSTKLTTVLSKIWLAYYSVNCNHTRENVSIKFKLSFEKADTKLCSNEEMQVEIEFAEKYQITKLRTEQQSVHGSYVRKVNFGRFFSALHNAFVLLRANRACSSSKYSTTIVRCSSPMSTSVLT